MRSPCPLALETIPVVQDDQIQEQSIPEEPIEAQPEEPTEVQSDKPVEVQPEEPVEMATAPVRRSARIASGVQPPQRYALLTKLQETTKKLEDVKERAKLEAIQKEILQIFEELKAVESACHQQRFRPADAEMQQSLLHD